MSGKAKASAGEPEVVSILAASGSEWLPADELRAAAVEAVASGQNVEVRLEGLEYLDATALQVLLALRKQLAVGGKTLELSKVSDGLRKWFVLAGAEESLFAPIAEAK